MSDPRPLGVFDSGIGGLTVLRVLRAHFPQESFIYLGDTARLPYGSKSPQTIRRYSEQNVHFLRGLGVKAAIIACNSASTQMREDHFEGLPIFNVIAPGAKAALAVSPRRRVGLIGTRATVASGAYEEELKKISPDTDLITQACPLLVPLAEEGWDGDPVTNLIVFRYLQTLLQHQIDSLIMGCTHYPLLQGSISRVTGAGVMLVDSGEALAAELESAFERKILQASTGPATLRLLLTDATGTFQELSRKILGPETPPPELVDLI